MLKGDIEVTNLPWAVFTRVSEALDFADAKSKREGKSFKVVKPRNDNSTYIVVEELDDETDISTSTLPPYAARLESVKERDDFSPIEGVPRTIVPRSGLVVEPSPTIVCGVEGFYDAEG